VRGCVSGTTGISDTGRHVDVSPGLGEGLPDLPAPPEEDGPASLALLPEQPVT